MTPTATQVGGSDSELELFQKAFCRLYENRAKRLGVTADFTAVWKGEAPCLNK